MSEPHNRITDLSELLGPAGPVQVLAPGRRWEGRDPEPDICLNCVLGNLTSCAQTRGCQDEWDGYYCCVEAAGCLELAIEDGRACATMECGEVFTAYQSCANPLQAECFPVQRMCFPP